MSSNAAPVTIKPFTIDASLEGWNLPVKEWLVKNGRINEWQGLASATAVFNANGQILLLQRAAHDSWPNRWEMPGGAVDNEDPTVLHGAARELMEEGGLTARRFVHIIAQGPNLDPAYVFLNTRKTHTWCRFAFLVEAENCDVVRLDPNEHQDFVWASEEEVREGKAGHRTLTITHDSAARTIMEAFRLRRELGVQIQAKV